MKQTLGETYSWPKGGGWVERSGRSMERTRVGETSRPSCAGLGAFLEPPLHVARADLMDLIYMGGNSWIWGP